MDMVLTDDAQVIQQPATECPATAAATTVILASKGSVQRSYDQSMKEDRNRVTCRS